LGRGRGVEAFLVGDIVVDSSVRELASLLDKLLHDLMAFQFLEKSSRRVAFPIDQIS